CGATGRRGRGLAPRARVVPRPGNNVGRDRAMRGRRNPLRRFPALVALLVGAAAASGQEKPPAPVVSPPPAAAQKPPEAPIPPFTESVDVTVTNVDVFVTDSKGQRVTGLKADDFDVKQDGIPQKITNFYAVSGGRVLFEDGTSVP